MIGWYVHHQGQGHLHRAQALVAEVSRRTGEEVTGLSTLAAPAGWPGQWQRLPEDATDPHVDRTARGQLHHAPLGGPGVRARSAALSAWIERVRPRAVVVDVSVEVTLLVRLHGVPVVSFVLPGRRDDVPHLTGMRAATALVAAWPAAAEAPPGADMLPGLPEDVRDRVVRLGGISRLEPSVHGPRHDSGPRRAVVLQGRGGGRLTPHPAEVLERRVPGWRWTVLGGGSSWVSDRSVLRRLLLEADVVVTQAGQGAIADLAALRVPAVVVPAERPFDEQRTSAATLAAGRWPVVVAEEGQALSPAVLERAALLDGRRWAGWCGSAPAARLAEVVEGVALSRPPRSTTLPVGAVPVQAGPERAVGV